MHHLEAKTSEELAQTVEPHAFSDAVTIIMTLGFRSKMLVMVMFGQYGL
jgi:hypothetical protein